MFGGYSATFCGRSKARAGSRAAGPEINPRNAFSYRSDSLSFPLARVGQGLSHTLPSGTEACLRYDAQSRSDFLDQGAFLKARWAF